MDVSNTFGPEGAGKDSKRSDRGQGEHFDSLVTPEVPAFESFLNTYTTHLAQLQLGTSFNVRPGEVRRRAFELRSEPASLSQISLTQRDLRRELLTRFASFARDATPQTADAVIAAISATNFRSIAEPGRLPRESFIAEIRNRDGMSLLLLDFKTQIVEGGLPIAILVREVEPNSEVPFSYTYLPTLKYFAGEADALKRNYSRPFEETTAPLLTHFMKRDIARALDDRQVATWRDQGGPQSRMPYPESTNPDFVEIVGIEKVVRWFSPETLAPLFISLETSHGSFSWIAAWEVATGRIGSSASLITSS